MPSRGQALSCGVPKEIRTQLAIDFKEAGGPKKFGGLEKLLKRDDRHQAYADLVHPSKLKRSVQNLITNWNSFTYEEWLAFVCIPTVIDNSATPPAQPSADEPKAEPKAEPTSSIQKSTPREPTKAQSTIVPKSQVAKTKSPKMPKKENKLGKQLVLPLPKGLYLAVIWADCNLNNMELSISDDGYSVIKRTKMPNPNSASELLAHYPWAKDVDNVVISTLEDELQSVRQSDSEEWEESILITLEKEVIREFVDNRGKPFPAGLTSVGQQTDKDGRKVITFFLKTVDAHRTTPAKVKFASGGLSGMSVSGDDSSQSSMFAEETVDDMRAEMDDMKTQFEKMLNSQQQTIQQQNQAMQEQMAQMMGFMQQFAQQQQQQQQQQPQQAVPDGAMSSGF